MPTATLTFNLPEEQDEFALATKAGALNSALYEYSQWLRSVSKHGDPEAVTFDECKDKFWEIMAEYEVNTLL